MSDKDEASNVYAFPYGEIQPKALLEMVRGFDFEEVVIIGTLKNGKPYLAGSMDSRPVINYLLDQAKQILLYQD